MEINEERLEELAYRSKRGMCMLPDELAYIHAAFKKLPREKYHEITQRGRNRAIAEVNPFNGQS